MRISRVALIFLFSLMASTPSLADQIRVQRVRGEVTHLSAGALTPRVLTLEDRFSNGVTVQTGGDGVVVLRLPNKTELILGRHSKLIIYQAAATAPNDFYLEKGFLRVNANETDGEKAHFLSTKEGVMRFSQAHFHLALPKDDRHLLLVYEGNLGFAKIDHDLLKRVSEEATRQFAQRQVERRNSGEVEVRDVLPAGMKRLFQLRTLTHEKRRVDLKSGQFSMLLPHWSKPTLPVFISPVQFNQLFQNTELVRPNLDPKERRQLSLNQSVQPVVPYGPASTKPEGILNVAKQELAFKSGGVLDFLTGHYIAPELDSSFDQNNQIYLPRAIGTIDEETGFYLSPEGLVLEIERGFVIREQNMPETRRQVLATQARRLNESLNLSLYKSGLKLVAQAGERQYSQREFFTKSQWQFRVLPFSQSFKQGDKFESDLGMNYQLSHFYHTSKSWQFYHQVQFKKLSFKQTLDAQILDTQKDTLFGLSVGLKKYLGPRFSALLEIGIDQNHFKEILPETAAFEQSLELVASTKIRALLDWQLIRSGRFRLENLSGLIYHFEKERGSLTTQSALGFYFELKAKYFLKPDMAIAVGPWLESMDQKVVAGQTEWHTERRSSGGLLELSYTY